MKFQLLKHFKPFELPCSFIRSSACNFGHTWSANSATQGHQDISNWSLAAHSFNNNKSFHEAHILYHFYQRSAFHNAAHHPLPRYSSLPSQPDHRRPTRSWLRHHSHIPRHLHILRHGLPNMPLLQPMGQQPQRRRKQQLQRFL